MQYQYLQCRIQGQSSSDYRPKRHIAGLKRLGSHRNGVNARSSMRPVKTGAFKELRTGLSWEYVGQEVRWRVP